MKSFKLFVLVMGILTSLLLTVNTYSYARDKDVKQNHFVIEKVTAIQAHVVIDLPTDVSQAIPVDVGKEENYLAPAAEKVIKAKILPNRMYASLYMRYRYDRSPLKADPPNIRLKYLHYCPLQT